MRISLLKLPRERIRRSGMATLGSAKIERYDERRLITMTATLDWSQCCAVESIPGKVSGAWVFKDTRMPVATVFQNLEAGLTVEEVMEEFAVTREQINAVLHFAAQSLVTPLPPPAHATSVDAHSL
jgi:uncharacterized protein (DUF433 family)